MSEEEACTICLDQLFQVYKSEVITRLQPCGHYYHSECINLWTDKSNSCPTCRRDFELVETITKRGEVLTCNRAQKKVIEHDEEFFYSDEDQIMQYDEDDILERRINNMIARSNICILCDSRRGNVSPCNTCSSTFHLSCLGASNLTSWYCPMCDAEQVNFERPSIFRRSRNSDVTNRVYNSFRESLMVSPVTVEVKERSTPMTVEEQQSWEFFETARKEESEQTVGSGSIQTSSNDQTASSVRKLKQPSRRGIRGRCNNNVPQQQQTPRSRVITTPQNISSSKSVVDTILGQMKERRPRETLPILQPSGSFASASSSSIALPLSPSSSSRSSTGSSPQPTVASLSTTPEKECSISLSNKSIWKSVPAVQTTNNIDPQSNILSLEQKNALQGMVRDRLRPLYKEGSIDFDQYTRINKKVSHILYGACLNGNDDQGYQQLAEYHVNEEVMKL